MHFDEFMSFLGSVYNKGVASQCVQRDGRNLLRRPPPTPLRASNDPSHHHDEHSGAVELAGTRRSTGEVNGSMVGATYVLYMTSDLGSWAMQAQV